LTLAEQRAYHQRKAEQAYTRRLKRLKDSDYRAAVISMSLKRLEEGEPLYGDSLFRREYKDLFVAEMEEDADALNYQLGRMYQGWT